jgi:2-polyprenyl-3-methyl-5-hydroxy-6-metoxy-1,4-benzoquinol methylase
MENPLKRLAGADADVFIDLKAWHMLGDLARRPLAAAPAAPRLLDFGCGAGAFLRALARRKFGGEMVGSDVSSGMLDEARKTWRSGMQSPTWALSTTGQLPFADRSFDIVTALCVLHHVMPADRPVEWREIARVLRPGGRCYVYEHNPYNPLTQWVVWHTPIDANAVLLTPAEVAGGLAAAGLSVSLRHGLMYGPPRWRWSWELERFVRWIPLGGQYVVAADKPADCGKGMSIES